MQVFGQPTQAIQDYWMQNFSPEAIARRRAAGEFRTRTPQSSTKVSPNVTVEMPSQELFQNPSPMTPASIPIFPQMPLSSVNAYEDRPRPYQPRFNLRSPMAMRPNGFNFPSQFNIAPFRTNTLLDYDWTS